MSDELRDGRLRFVRSLGRGPTSLTEEALLSRLNETPIAVVVAARDAGWQDQIAALTAVNLLARLFRQLVIVAHEDIRADPAVPYVEGPFAAALAAFAQRVHPDVRAEISQVVPIEAIALHFGVGSKPSGSTDVFCCGAGWLSRVARRPVSLPQPVDQNPVGPLVAAALAVAEVFKIVFGDVLTGVIPALDVTFSALTYETGETDLGPAMADLNLPETLLVGAGSIGSALLWGLSHASGLSGALMIVDPDRLGQHNPDRAILVLDEAAHQELEKALWASDVVKQYLPQLSIRGLRLTVREFVDTLDEDYVLPLIISAVDSVESRRDIQDAVPREILNASTGATNVELSRHAEFAVQPCLYCLYLPDVLSRSPIELAMERTGFSQKDVAELMIPDSARMLTTDNVRGIERRNDLKPGALRMFEGRRLSELLQDQLWYGQAPVSVDSGQALLTTAFVSALAGFLLLAELLKAADPALAQFRLTGVYQQELLGIPNGFAYTVNRDGTGYCLCHSPLRRQLYREKYSTPVGTQG